MVYTINKLAKLAGVSVRTLHYYDQIGILKPSSIGDNSYRYYGQAELETLQQILFFRELDFPLADIGRIMRSDSFNELASLENHRQLLSLKQKRLKQLLATLDQTIRSKKGNTMLTDTELYEGFTAREIEEMKREVREKYDPKLVAQSERRVRSWSKEDWEMIKAEGGEIITSIAKLMDQSPDSPEVQALVARHHAHINRFYDCSLEIYRGLGEMYVADPRFTAFYEKITPGLAVFMRDAMVCYAATQSEIAVQ